MQIAREPSFGLYVTENAFDLLGGESHPAPHFGRAGRLVPAKQNEVHFVIGQREVELLL